MATEHVRARGAPIVCDHCGRTLLVGETVASFRDGVSPRVVCAVCERPALARGWLRTGTPDPPPGVSDAVPEPRRRLVRRNRTVPVDGPNPSVGVAPGAGGDDARVVVPVGPEADRAGEARRRDLQVGRQALSEQAVDAALEAFSASAHRRTVVGISRTLGLPRVSIVALAGDRPDVIVTVAWDLSWYQFRIDVGATPPVKLAARGDELSELEPRWRRWNGNVALDGSISTVES